MGHARKKEDERRLKKLAGKMGNGYYESGVYYDSRKGRYVRIWANHRDYTRGLRRRHAKRTRMKLKEKDLGPGKGNGYRKVSEYRWDLY